MNSFTLTVNILYKNHTSIMQKYNLTWESCKKTFMQHMTDIMETLSVAEEPDTLERIDVIEIVFSNKPDDLNQIHEFVNGTNIKCNV